MSERQRERGNVVLCTSKGGFDKPPSRLWKHGCWQFRGRTSRGRPSHAKLFCLLPYWFLRRPQSKGRVGKAVLSKRFDQFENGQRATLHEEAERGVLGFHKCHHAMTLEQKAKAAEQRVREGEVSRARQCLTGAALARGNDATFQEMQSDRCRKKFLILSGHSCSIGSKHISDESEKCASRIFIRTWRLDVRASERITGQHRHVRVAVVCLQQFVPGQDPTRHRRSSDWSQIDSAEQT